MNINFEKINSLENLEFHREDYLLYKERNSKLCKICTQWKSLDLPYDCITKPPYCLKNAEEIIFTLHFEEAEERIKNYG